MSFSDARFPYGPFVPHPVARQYIESYFQLHHCDQLMELNTTLEDLSAIPTDGEGIKEGVHPTTPNRWKLVLRAYDPARHIDIWREETFDAVVLANGHYSVPFVRASAIWNAEQLTDIVGRFHTFLVWRTMAATAVASSCTPSIIEPL